MQNSRETFIWKSAVSSQCFGFAFQALQSPLLTLLSGVGLSSGTWCLRELCCQSCVFLHRAGEENPLFRVITRVRFPVGVLWDAHGTSYCDVPGLDQFLAPKRWFLLEQKLLASQQFH